jgi:MYXO-CTERM domain-containing protein
MMGCTVDGGVSVAARRASSLRRAAARAALAAGVLWAAAFGTAWAQAGASWTTLGPPGGTVTVLLTSPLSDSVLYAGTPENGIFVSADAGATWAAANNGLPASPAGRQLLRAVYAMASDGVRLYAATEAGLFHAVPGPTPQWSALAGPPTATPVTMLAFDAATSRLIAATGGTDGLAVPGVHVTSIDVAVPPAPAWTFTALPAAAGSTVDALALVPAQGGAPSALLASVGSRLFAAPLQPATASLGWSDADPAGALAAGSITALHYSTEFLQAYACSGGAALLSGNPLEAAPVWQVAPVAAPGSIPFTCHAFATLPRSAGGAARVLLGTDEGAFVSVDGVSFLATGTTGPSGSVNAFAVSRAAGAPVSTMFIGTGFGIASSAATTLVGGAAWTPANGPATLVAAGASQRLDNANIVDSAVLGTTLYAAGVGTAYSDVFASADDGATWTATNVASVLGANDIVLSLLGDGAHATLYAATTRGLLAYSTATGRWSAVASSVLTSRVTALAFGASSLFVGTDDGLWSIRLDANPAAALPVAAGLNGASVRALLVDGGNVLAATIDATDANAVFTATEGSASAGTAVWASYASGSAGTSRITALLPVGGGLLAATAGNLLLFAAPGSAWAPASMPADTAQQISDPYGVVNALYTDGVSLFAATGSNGVFVSPLTTGFSWTPHNGSGPGALPSLEVHALRAFNGSLLASTRAGLASVAGLAVGGPVSGGGGGGGGTPPPPTSSTDAGGGAADAWFGALLGLALLALRRRRPRPGP